MVAWHCSKITVVVQALSKSKNKLAQMHVWLYARSSTQVWY